MQPNHRALCFRSVATTLLVSATLALPLSAADHMEAPAARADLAADLADLYVWHQGDRLITVLTFDGLKAPVAGQSGTYDADVLYEIHLGRDAFGNNYEAAVDISLQFTANGSGGWNINASNVPGVSGTISGGVGTVIDSNGVKLYASLADDPFFFDLEGFNNTLQTGTLMFDGNRDSVAGLNCTAIVLEMDLDSARAGSTMLHVWATSSRKDG